MIQYPSDSDLGLDVFGNKSQGYPYQLLIFAIGIIIENLYPKDAYVWGGVEKGEVENIFNWLQALVDFPIQMPICYDGDNLWQRLDKCYRDKSLAYKRFEVLYRGSFEGQLEFLIKHAGYDVLIECNADELASYNSPFQYGAEKILLTLFNVRKNVKELIELVNIANSLKEENEELFNLKDLLKLLSSLFITIPIVEREPIRLFSITSSRMVNIEEALTRIILNFYNTPEDVNLYIKKEKLVDLFLENSELDKIEITEVIEEAEKICYEQIEKCIELIKQAEKQEKDNQKIKESEQIKSEKKSNIPKSIIPEISENEIYFFEQAYLQTPEFVSRQEAASEMGVTLKKLIDKEIDKGSKYFISKDREQLLRWIYRFSHKIGFGLKYSTWNNIDNESEIEKLYYFLVLSMLKDNSHSFWVWRRHIMESSDLWDFLMQRKKLCEIPKEILDK
ncbi:MAG: hypothetical protein K8S23_02565 [Candidatus Cloacimonetes bacterium]|nr:hypothetical protein [Candidatus Cloacimonadota bacterium]